MKFQASNLRGMLLGFLAITTCTVKTLANTAATPDMPLDHCYHWLDENKTGKKFLSYKTEYAKANQGEFSFYTRGGNGAAAGQGIYCAKTPAGSYTYGDRVVRLDFVDDVVFSNDITYGTKFCGTGKFQIPHAECQKKEVDVILYNSASDWYVIRNPKAIKSWSASSETLIRELEESKPENSLYARQADNVIIEIKKEILSQGGSKIHFNAKARSSLLEILKDPAKKASVSGVAMIAMLSAYIPNADLLVEDRATMLDQYLDKVLADPKLKSSDLSATLKDHQDVQDMVSKKVRALMSEPNTENSNLIEISKLAMLTNMDLPSAQMQRLVQMVIQKNSDWAELVQSVKEDSPWAQEVLNQYLKSKIETDETNAQVFLALLNKCVKNSTPLIQQKLIFLLGKILSVQADAKVVAILDKAMTNPALQKEKAYLNLIQNPKSLPMPITLALADVAQDQLTSAQKAGLKKKVLDFLLQTDQSKVGDFFSSVVNRSIELPSFVLDTEFLLKATEAILKRQDDKTPIDLFQAFAGDFSGLLGARYEKKPIVVTTFFRDLTLLMVRFQRFDYAYAALLTYAESLGTEDSVKSHPIEHILERQKSGKLDKYLMPVVDNVISKSTDMTVFQYLVDIYSEKSHPLKAQGTRLLTLMIDFTFAPGFEKIATSSHFKISTAEKATWSRTASKYASNYDRYAGNPCTFFSSVSDAEEALKKAFPILSKNKAQFTKVREKVCQ